MSYKIYKINDDTWRIENEFVRAFLLAGSEKALLIDSGATLPEARTIAESLTDKPVMLINTHGDGDHTSGNNCFLEFYINEKDYINCGLQSRFPCSRPIFTQDGMIISLGGRDVKIIDIPGHTFGSIALIDSKYKAMYSGDSVSDTHIFMFGKHRAPDTFELSLNKLTNLKNEFDVVYPSHGSEQVEPSQIDNVLAEWKKVISGQYSPHDLDMHGTTVASFDCDNCGFYCNK